MARSRVFSLKMSKHRRVPTPPDCVACGLLATTAYERHRTSSPLILSPVEGERASGEDDIDPHQCNVRPAPFVASQLLIDKRSPTDFGGASV